MRQGKLVFSVALGLTLVVISPGQGFAKRIDGSETAPTVEKTTLKQKAWLVSQQTDGLKTYTVCVANDAIKFVSGHLSVIARKPDWQIEILNERAKTFWTMPLNEFNGLKSMETFAVKKLDHTKRNDAEYRIAKRKVVAQEGKPEYDADKLKKLGFTPAKITVWSSSDVKVDPGELNVLSRLYGLEGVEGIPMRIEMETDKGEKIECLSTTWCFDRELPQDFFKIPKQFDKGKTRDEVETQEGVTTLRSKLKNSGTKIMKERQDAQKEKATKSEVTPKPAAK